MRVTEIHISHHTIVIKFLVNPRDEELLFRKPVVSAECVRVFMFVRVDVLRYSPPPSLYILPIFYDGVNFKKHLMNWLGQSTDYSGSDPLIASSLLEVECVNPENGDIHFIFLL